MYRICVYNLYILYVLGSIFISLAVNENYFCLYYLFNIHSCLNSYFMRIIYLLIFINMGI